MTMTTNPSQPPSAPVGAAEEMVLDALERAPGSREWMAEVCRAAALSLAAHGVRNDQLLKVADWIAQQPTEDADAVSAGGWYQGGDRTCGPNATTFRFIRDDNGIVAFVEGSRDVAMKRAARIVECVNACTGIADPAAFIWLAKQAGAARGDVRGLVAKLAAHVRPTCSELWDEAQAFLAAKGKHAGKVKLSYNDLCRLSSVFNDHSELHLEQDRRINEWISERIAESLAGERNGYQRPTYSE